MGLYLVSCHVLYRIHGDAEKLDFGVHSLDIICHSSHIKAVHRLAGTPADWRVITTSLIDHHLVRTLNTSTWLLQMDIAAPSRDTVT